MGSKVNDAVFFFLWPRVIHFAWDRSHWRDRDQVIAAIVAPNQDRWARRDQPGKSILIYRQVLMLMWPRRVVSIVVSDGGDIALSNQPRDSALAFATIAVASLALFEFADVVMTATAIRQCTQLLCSQAVFGLAFLIAIPLGFYACAALNGWLNWLPSRGLSIALAERLAALPNVVDKIPS